MHILDGTRATRPDRRSAERRVGDEPAPAERRSGDDRRSGAERRREVATASGQVLAAFGLLARAVEAGGLPDDERRLVDAAMFRLRVALEQLDG
jgi:hypothetical protein